MKVKKSESYIKILTFVYLIINLFYGIIKKNLRFNNFLIKNISYLPDLILIVLLGVIIINEKKIKINYLFYSIFYVSFIGIISLNNMNSMVELIYLFKGIFLPLLLLYFINTLEVYDKNNQKYIKKIINLFKLYSISGFILGIVQRIMDWKWTSKFYTGRTFYLQDELTKIKIWHAGGKLRVPSLTGNSVSFAMISLLIFVYFLYSRENIEKKWIYILCLLGNMYVSTNKTSIIIGIIILLQYFIKKYNNKTKMILIGLLINGIIFSLYFINIDSKMFFSLKERIYFWKKILDKHLIDILFPINLYKYSSASKSGFISVMDNTYMFFLFSLGIIGLIIYIKILLSLYKSKINGIKCTSIVVAFYSLTTNITQGVSLLSLLVIFKIIYTIDFNSRKRIL